MFKSTLLRKRGSLSSKARYDALISLLQTAESETGLYLSDANVDRENVSTTEADGDRFWDEMYFAAANAAGTRAENAGRDINKLVGQVIY